MGLLDEVLGGVLGGRGSGSNQGMQGGGLGGGLGGGMLGGGGGSSPLMMALMALLSSGALGGQGGGGLGGLLGGLTGGSGNAGAGGLGGLLNRFQQSGHGDIMNSWMNDGPNRSIAPHQLNEALGADTVDQLSRQTGMSQDDLLNQLSQSLPEVVDKMTPHGRMPTQEETARW